MSFLYCASPPPPAVWPWSLKYQLTYRDFNVSMATLTALQKAVANPIVATALTAGARARILAGCQSLETAVVDLEEMVAQKRANYMATMDGNVKVDVPIAQAAGDQEGFDLLMERHTAASAKANNALSGCERILFGDSKAIKDPRDEEIAALRAALEQAGADKLEAVKERETLRQQHQAQQAEIAALQADLAGGSATIPAQSSVKELPEGPEVIAAVGAHPKGGQTAGPTPSASPKAGWKILAKPGPGAPPLSTQADTTASASQEAVHGPQLAPETVQNAPAPPVAPAHPPQAPSALHPTVPVPTPAGHHSRPQASPQALPQAPPQGPPQGRGQSRRQSRPQGPHQGRPQGQPQARPQGNPSYQKGNKAHHDKVWALQEMQDCMLRRKVLAPAAAEALFESMLLAPSQAHYMSLVKNTLEYSPRSCNFAFKAWRRLAHAREQRAAEQKLANPSAT